MNRTQSHYIRANSKNKQLMLNDNSSAFHGIKQTYVYDNLPKPKNVGSQFEALPRKKMRSQW